MVKKSIYRQQELRYVKPKKAGEHTQQGQRVVLFRSHPYKLFITVQAAEKDIANKEELSRTCSN